MTRTPAQQAEDAEIIRLCNQTLDLLRQTCGKHLNDDGTVWCARTSGHDGECRGITVTL